MPVPGSADALAEFVSGLSFARLPPAVVTRSEELFLDWLASALAGKGSEPVRALESFALSMGPHDGPSEILVSRRLSSPWFAALINAAASHVVEQDDIHNRSVVHPGTVVFPPALAVAQALGRPGRDLITAAVAGYEVACRVGEYLGPTHYRVFHSTGTAGTLGAAAAVAHLLRLGVKATRDALGSAGTQAAGLWEFLRDAADSKQLHTAKAAGDGLLAAYLAREGFSGARDILTGERGMGAGLSARPENERLTQGLGATWAVLDTSFKFHASCRHT
ncbi:MAG: MmgE/PrpD family protein, partial [Gammaproteobacteria bacterium]|nr:MmgE/PrpD family protein [Gammaproteobacteria bacterium]